jgi:ABC-type phosphate/phosphonate transport system substrate-binding protein
MTRRSLVTPALLAAVAVAGCGGSKELSRSELVAKANTICKHGNDALKTSKISPANLATVAPQVAAVDRQVSSELAKLKPPSAMSADWAAIVDGWQKAGEGLTKIGQAAQAKQKTQEMIGEGIFTKAQDDRAVTARRNGLESCGEF